MARRSKLFFLAFSSWLCSWPPLAAAADLAPVDPVEVFAETRRVGREVELLLHHFNTPAFAVAEPVKAELLPRHVVQMCYLVLGKLDVVRHKYGLAPLPSGRALAPAEADLGTVYEQVLRISAELGILKRRLGIAAEAAAVERGGTVQPVDLFNELHQTALDLDALSGEESSPTQVFAEALRLDEDVTELLRALQVEDATFPPAKELGGEADESLADAFALLEEIQRLQRGAGIARTDFAALRKSEDVRPSDVLLVVSLALAELQTLKVQAGVRSATPPAVYQELKSSADVHQLLRWTTRRLQQIRQLR